MESLNSLRKIRRTMITENTQRPCTCWINGDTMVCLRKTKESPCIQAMRNRRLQEIA